MANIDEATLRELERRRGAALVARDAAVLDEIFAHDLVHIHSTGVKQTKAELMAYVTETVQFLSIERPGLHVTVVGDAALMTGRMHNMLQSPGKDPIEAKAHCTQVWFRRDGAWRLSAFHATRVAEPAK